MKNSLFCVVALFWGQCILAQVPVREEPRHKNVFENGIIRVLDVHITPGDTTLFHIHETPSLFVTFSNTKTGSQEINEPKKEGRSTAGATSYSSFTKRRVHRVWNSDSSLFHVMDLEILTRGDVHASHPLTLPDMKLKQDEERARIYELKLKAKETTHLLTSSNPILIIVIAGELIIENQEGMSTNLHPSSFHWIKESTDTKVTNRGNSIVDCRVFEIKL